MRTVHEPSIKYITNLIKMLDVGACVALAMSHITRAVIPVPPMYSYLKKRSNKKKTIVKNNPFVKGTSKMVGFVNNK